MPRTMNHQTRVTKMTILPEGEPIYSEGATRIEIDDEGAGEFVVVSQDKGKILIDPEEWRPLREAINKMIEQCRGEKR